MGAPLENDVWLAERVTEVKHFVGLVRHFVNCYDTPVRGSSGRASGQPRSFSKLHAESLRSVRLRQFGTDPRITGWQFTPSTARMAFHEPYWGKRIWVGSDDWTCRRAGDGRRNG